MEFYRRPWEKLASQNSADFHIDDSLNGLASRNSNQEKLNYVPILESDDTSFVLFPYPKKGMSKELGMSEFPTRHRGQPIETEQDKISFELTNEMNNLIARVQELEEALDDPANVWQRLRKAWSNAEEDSKPRMSEIVRQASNITPYLTDLERKIRRILRRDREKVQLDRVQEMDRASMRWLSRQPGNTLAQRAGSDQRVMAIVRKENFDTVENRVVHSYTLLAEKFARIWLTDHPKAQATQRYKLVEKLQKKSRNFANELSQLGVGKADTNVTPNYVLMQDKNYREVYEAWLRLIRQDIVLDDLWSWQGQIWTDFCALAIVLSLNNLSEAELIAQSPIIWNETSDHGRWFDLHQPLAIFWLRETRRIIEVFVRPKKSNINYLTRAPISLKISEQDGDEVARRMLVWTPHNLARSDFEKDLDDAAKLIGPIPSNMGNVRNGLILIPSHGEYSEASITARNKQMDLVALGPSGVPLGKGMNKISGILRSQWD